MPAQARSRPSQKQRMGGNRERKTARNGLIWGGGVRRTLARNRASTGAQQEKKRGTGLVCSPDMVVGADPGSIPFKCKPASTRYDPAEGCGKVRTPTLTASPTANFRILPILSFK